MYDINSLNTDPTMRRLLSLPPGTEITKDVYQTLRTRVHPLPLPDYARVKSPLGISEGFLYGIMYCWDNDRRMFPAFGISRRKGQNYYYLGLASIDGNSTSRLDIKKAMRDPSYFLRMRMKGKL